MSVLGLVFFGWSFSLLASVAVASAAVASDRPAESEEPGKTLAVLLVGNSLTYANDMPALLASLLEDAGYEATVEAIAHPNFGLEDHWQRREVHRALRRGGWDFVVLQQGPSATEGRPSLLEYGRRFGDLAREHGAESAFYMVWPSRARFGDFDGVADSYAAAADAAQAVLLPAGDAWRAAWRLDPDLALYGPDGFHPTGAGSLLAALVLAEGLTCFGEPRESAEGSGTSGKTAETLRILRRAASETVANRCAARAASAAESGADAGVAPPG